MKIRIKGSQSAVLIEKLTAALGVEPGKFDEGGQGLPGAKIPFEGGKCCVEFRIQVDIFFDSKREGEEILSRILKEVIGHEPIPLPWGSNITKYSSQEGGVPMANVTVYREDEG